MAFQPDKYYRIYCITEETWTYGWKTEEPTLCFNNAAHTVNPNSVLEMPNENQTVQINSNGDVFGISNIKMAGFQQLSDVSVPTQPTTGNGTLYKKTGDSNLYWQGDKSAPEIKLSNIFGSYYEIFSDSTLYTTTSNSLREATSFTTQSLIAGNYRIGWSIEWSIDGSRSGTIEIQLDETLLSSISTVLRGSLDDETFYSGFTQIPMTSGTHVISIHYRTSNNKEMKIKKINIEVGIVSY